LKILGISAYYHDSAAAIVVDGEIIAAAQEERFTRIKHDPSFPANAVKYCLEQTGLKIDELDAFVFYISRFLSLSDYYKLTMGSHPEGCNHSSKLYPFGSRKNYSSKKQLKQN
jgi:carbamoyltransferase